MLKEVNFIMGINRKSPGLLMLQAFFYVFLHCMPGADTACVIVNLPENNNIVFKAPAKLALPAIAYELVFAAKSCVLENHHTMIFKLTEYNCSLMEGWTI